MKKFSDLILGSSKAQELEYRLVDEVDGMLIGTEGDGIDNILAYGSELDIITPIAARLKGYKYVKFESDSMEACFNFVNKWAERGVTNMVVVNGPMATKHKVLMKQ